MTTELSGRELDAAVCERVLGKCWHVWRDGEPGASMGDAHLICRKCGIANWDNFKPENQRKPELRNESYSSDWSAAGQLVEKLRERGWRVRLYSDGCAAHLLKELFDDGVWGRGESIPEALARAALKTVEDKP